MNQPTIEISTGKLAGVVKDGIQVFYGIPFAAPPTGRLRWKKPQPIEPWSGTREATRYAPAAPQDKIPVLNVGKRSEDCLYLNVWTPGTTGKRPVMLWIHGGGFLVGSASQREYSGRRLATAGDVVVVSINYRLGALGFAAFEHDDPHYDLNVGIHDQIAALQWVHENISEFGGDPENVTIFGESAGGMSVGTLLATPAAGNLFHKAIAQSGATHHYISREDAHRVSDKLADILGVDPSNVEKMLHVPAKEIVRAQRRTGRIAVNAGPWKLPQLGMNYIPVIDDELFPQGVHPAVVAGNARYVPLMTGTTAEEWQLFAMLSELVPQRGGSAMVPGKQTPEALEKSFEARVPGHGKALLHAYRELVPNANAARLDEMLETDRLFFVPAQRMAEAQAEHAPVYVYRFDWQSPMFGAGHASDIPFVFGNVNSNFGKMFSGGGPEADRLSRKVQQAWTSFAHTGRPAADGLTDWPAFDSRTRDTMVFDRETHIEPYAGAARLALWDKIK